MVDCTGTAEKGGIKEDPGFCLCFAEWRDGAAMDNPIEQQAEGARSSVLNVYMGTGGSWCVVRGHWVFKAREA